jgi:hypothetical protein
MKSEIQILSKVVCNSEVKGLRKGGEYKVISIKDGFDAAGDKARFLYLDCAFPRIGYQDVMFDLSEPSFGQIVAARI